MGRKTGSVPVPIPEPATTQATPAPSSRTTPPACVVAPFLSQSDLPLAWSRSSLYNPLMPRPQVIASHLILTGYGHWLSNDPRGSGSIETRNPALEPLGPIHFGRKAVQPPREDVRAFYCDAAPRLEHPTLWFDDRTRALIADALAGVVAQHAYTVYAAAICSNHAHLLVRRHRDDWRMIWNHLADASRSRLQEALDLPVLPGAGPGAEHPVWAARPYAVFKRTPDTVRDCVQYVRDNPEKEGLAPSDLPLGHPLQQLALPQTVASSLLTPPPRSPATTQATAQPSTPPSPPNPPLAWSRRLTINPTSRLRGRVASQ